MKHLKMLGLAAIAALGLMAFVGAGTASATTLCETTGGPCYGVGQEIHGVLSAGVVAKLTDTSGNTIAECKKSTVKGSIEGSNTGTWVGGNVSALTWEECSQTTETVNKGRLEVMQTTGDEAEVVSKEANVTVAIFGVSCVYGTGEGTKLGTVAGGTSIDLNITVTVKRTAGGFLCPSTGIWHAKFTLTTPNFLHFIA